MSDDRGGFPGDSGRPSFGSRSQPRSARAAIEPESVPPPPSRSRSVRNPWVVFGHSVISLLFLAVILGGGAVLFGSRYYEAPGPLTEEKTVLIPRGAGTTDIADTLEKAGIIDSPLFFATAARVFSSGDALKAGEYLFKPRISMHGVVDILTEGKGIQHSLTIPEGLTSQAIMERLAQDDVLTGEVPAPPREGSVLPDTYKYQRGTTRAQLLARMETEQKEALEEIWKTRSPNLPLKSPAELVTLASIVEKETGQADERTRVARVFINRLQKNMRLQSDPTVIYGIAGGKGKLDRSITRQDLDTPTPYNTYTNGGLPPGPIGNPGKAAMEAVANPSVTKDLYFVADGTGGHAFAETLDDHNKNVARWRKLEQQANAPAAVPPAAAAAPADGSAPPQPVDTPQAGDATATAPVADAGAAPEMLPAQNGRRKRTFNDPVANTPKDPLLNNTFDLNSPQTVPKL